LNINYKYLLVFFLTFWMKQLRNINQQISQLCQERATFRILLCSFFYKGPHNYRAYKLKKKMDRPNIAVAYRYRCLTVVSSPYISLVLNVWSNGHKRKAFDKSKMMLFRRWVTRKKKIKIVRDGLTVATVSCTLCFLEPLKRSPKSIFGLCDERVTALRFC